MWVDGHVFDSNRSIAESNVSEKYYNRITVFWLQQQPALDEVAAERAKKRASIEEAKGLSIISSGPSPKRSCTDVLWLLAFGAVLCAWAILIHYGEFIAPKWYPVIRIVTGILFPRLNRYSLIRRTAIKHGKISRLWSEPTDSEGRRCGIESDVKMLPYLMYFDLSRCMDPWVALYGCDTTKVCVEECKQEDWWIYLYECDVQLQQYRNHLQCKLGVKFDTCAELERLIRDEICYQFNIASQPSEFARLPSASFSFMYFRQQCVWV